MNLITSHEKETSTTLDYALAVSVVATVVAGTVQSTILLFWPVAAEASAPVTVPIQFIMGTFSLVALFLRHKHSNQIIQRYAKIKS